MSKIVQNPWKVIFLSLAAMMVIGSYMRYVRPSVSYKDMLGPENPILQKYEKIQSDYTNDDNLLVLIEAKEGKIFSREILTGIRDLTEELWKTPYSIRVDSLTNHQHTEAKGDDLIVADLVEEPETLTSEQIKKIERIGLSEPLLLNRALNRDGDVLAISVSFAFPNESAEEKLAADAFVQKAAQKFREKYPNTTVHVAGLVALDATVMRISQKETGMFLMLVMGIVVFLLIFILRSIKPILVSVLVFIFSVVAGMALSGMLGWKLTPFTASVPMIILILAVADCVHYITSFTQHLRAGQEKKEALINALKLNFQPIAITSITTSIGFLTLNLSDSASIGALGTQVAFGVMVAFILSVTFLPAVLALLPFKSGTSKAQATGRYDKFTDFLYRYKGALLALSLVLTGIFGYSLTKNEFNDNIPTYFAKSLPWRQANDFSEEKFGGAYTFAYSLNSGQPGGVPDPKFLKQVDQFTTWLRSLPEVVYVNSITDTFRRLNKNMHADDQSYYRLPEKKDLAAQYLLLYEMSLPYGLDLNNQINFDKSATKILVIFKTLSTTQVLEMENRIQTWLDENLKGIKTTGSGVQMMFAHLLDKDTKGLTLGAFFGLFIISLLLIFAFRSFKIGIISIIPNVLPAVMAFGVWGIFVGQVGMGLAMVSGMTIGIIVDDTVHFLSKYLKARREKGLAAKEAVSYTFENVGPSIVFTTVVLVAGFIAMAFLSEFRVNSDMGKMTAIILSFALLLDMITLPILLMIFDRKTTK